MRTQRERRNEHGWSFQNFFFLQEELAFVLEMLGLYDEALVQYDELDALFTQFVINSNVGGKYKIQMNIRIFLNRLQISKWE